MLTPRENFQRMLRHDGPQWLPFDVPTTPPIADLIEQKTGESTSVITHKVMEVIEM